jgi:hypothetical protein
MEILIPLVFLAIVVAAIVAGWKIYVKAGQPGWASLVPIYNLIVMLKIVGRPAWWLVLALIPFVNLVIVIILLVDLAKSFGKSGGFAVALLFMVGYFILGFGDAQYQGPAAAKAQ